MPRRKTVQQDVATSSSGRGRPNNDNAVLYKASSSSTGIISTSAILKALDGHSSPVAAIPSSSKAKGKKRAKEATSTSDEVADETPKPKRSRKKKDPDAPPPEKRGAIFKSRCPQNILERVGRVISQKFFLVDRRRYGDDLKEEFNVLGSTGNIYVVTIDRRPSCTCPDAMKGNHCKHILFVFTKVLQVAQSSHVWYQKALLTSELEEIFRNAPPAPNVMANARIREAYDQASGKASSRTSPQLNRRMPGAEDSCPVCYEAMEGDHDSSLTWCQTCGNALHKECFQQWAKKKSHDLDCVYCRAPWTLPGSKVAGGGSSKEGYINLAHVAGVSPVRDTSSYYQGPRRGQHYYGYQDYDDNCS